MRLKQCTKCGKSFQTDNTFQAMCDECLAASKKSTLATRTCRQCGVKFTGGPRAWYCPECRESRVKEQRKQCRKNGPKRPIGSTDKCVVCGAEYIVVGPNQRYCKSCAEEATREADRKAGIAYYYEKDYNKTRSTRGRHGTKLCVICGKPFSGRGVSVVCSDECKAQLKKLYAYEADIKRGNPRKNPSINRLDQEHIEKPEA